MSQAERDCEFVRLLPDGRVVVRRQGVEETADVNGIEIVEPTHPLLAAIGQGLDRGRERPVCTVHAVAPDGRPRVAIRYFGWHDKSGDVWLDLATTLVERGLARATVDAVSRVDTAGRDEQSPDRTGRGR